MHKLLNLIVILLAFAFYKNEKKSNIDFKEKRIYQDSIETTKSYLDSTKVFKYETYYNSCKYKLKVREKTSASLSFSFQILENDSMIFSLENTLYNEENESGESEGVYGITTYGKYYFNRTNEFKTYMTFSRNEKFVKFYYDIDYYDNEQDKRIRELCRHLPLFLKEGEDDEFKIKIEELLSDYHWSIRQLQKPNNQYREFRKNDSTNYYNSFIELTSRLIDSPSKTKILSDTSIFDELTYYDLQPFKEELIEMGLHQRAHISDSVIQKIHVDSINKFSCIVRHDFYWNILSNRFEKIFYKNLDLRNNLPLGYSLHRACNEIPNTFDNKFLFVIPDLGFEQRQHIMTIWTKEDEYYKLYSILDTSFNVGIGALSIDTIWAINENKHIIIGKTEGFDGGYSWGSFWLGQITDLRYLNVLYKSDISSCIWEDEGEYYESNDYIIDPINKEVILKKYLKTKKDSIYNNELVKVDTIKYLDLIRK